MTTPLPPYSSRLPIGRLPDGTPVQMDDYFARWLSQFLFTRVGGSTELSNTELASTASEELIAGTGDDSTDNSEAFTSTVSPTGSVVAAGLVRARIKKGGTYRINGLTDLHPSISLPMEARGGIVIRAGDSLPATNADGGEAALFRVVRDSPASSSVLAWAPTYSGFNIDGRKGSQVNVVHGFRIPNPNPANNTHDPDPDYQGNKDYVAGHYAFGDVGSCSGSGVVVESGNGRAHLNSYRSLNNELHGFDLGGNDVVIDGHSAAGGNGGFGIKTGAGSGYLLTNPNIWGSAVNRSLTCGAFWSNGSKLLSIVGAEFNDWARFDGNNAFWRSPCISNVLWAPFNELFSADGVAIDTTGTGPDLRLQSAFAVTDYQNMVVGPSLYSRTTKVAFATPNNIGGDLTGNYGTAMQYLWDFSANAMACVDLPVSSAPNVKPWVNTDATLASYLDPVPIRCRTGAQAVYYMKDSYKGLHRLGARGVQSHFMAACDETDEPNYTYVAEIGDNTARNIMYGATEFQQAPQFTSAGYDARPLLDGDTRNVKAGDAFQALSISGTIAAATVALPNTMAASYFLTIMFVGGACTALTWTGTFNPNDDGVPSAIHGDTGVSLFYRQDTDQWYVINVWRISDPWVTLTDAATIATDAELGNKFRVTLGGNRTLGNPSNMVDGQSFKWRVTQDATGARTLAYGGKFKFPGGAPTLSVAVNAVDMITGTYDATADLLYCEINKAYS